MRGSPIVVVVAVCLGLLVGIGGYTFVYARGYSYLTNDRADAAAGLTRHQTRNAGLMIARVLVLALACAAPHGTSAARRELPQAFSHVGLINSALNLSRRRAPAVERSAE